MIPAMAEYPQDAVHQLFVDDASPWWVKNGKGPGDEPGRWDLLVSLVPHLGDVPHRAFLTRVDDHAHGKLEATVSEFHIGKHRPRPDSELPAAAFPDGAFIYGGKVRPVLVVGHVHRWPNRAMRGSASTVTKPSLSVAPFYGVEADGSRAGFPHEFVTRIRQAKYPQFFWDRLPTGLPHTKQVECSSILRLDQMFPIYRRRDSETAAWASTGWSLSPKARDVVEEWMQWLLLGGVPSDGIIATFRDVLKEMAGEQPA